MSTTLVTAKRAELTRTNKLVNEMAKRLDRAWQSRNEKVMRADSEYYEACRRAMDTMGTPDPTDQAPPTPTLGTEQASV